MAERTQQAKQRDAQPITIKELKSKLSRMQALLGEITANVEKIESLGYIAIDMTNARSPERAIKDTTSWLRGAMMSATDCISAGPKTPEKKR